MDMNPECGETRDAIRKTALLFITEDMIKVATLLRYSDVATDRQLSLVMDGVHWLEQRLTRNREEATSGPVS